MNQASAAIGPMKSCLNSVEMEFDKIFLCVALILTGVAVVVFVHVQSIEQNEVRSELLSKMVFVETNRYLKMFFI